MLPLELGRPGQGSGLSGPTSGYRHVMRRKLSATEDSPYRGAFTCFICESSKSFCWRSVEARERGCQLRCQPRHLNVAQNFKFRRK
ncbi:hypothetical protein TNCV_5044141 [Trichonephila clavipes]|uniref:Uncharacterized protein n=1 Tax=Trichonephila clavipes TaxID=2585209 RepID=A0A8X6WIP8_TRICX|nr:hypothetical protein TNCV_5044141 [Trichonephila clavipes]